MIVILHTGDVESKTDGNIHRIGVEVLKRLYGVLPSDEVFVDDGHCPSLREIRGIHLYPRYSGNYYDIHSGKDGGR